MYTFKLMRFPQNSMNKRIYGLAKMNRAMANARNDNLANKAIWYRWIKSNKEQ